MKRSTLIFPYVFWAAVFIILPLVLVAWFSVRIDTTDGVQLGLENFTRFFDRLYVAVLWRSIKLAFVSTAFCLVLGYPLALILADRNLKHRETLLLLFILPMWMNFLLRTYALMSLLENNGLLNRLLVTLGLPARQFLYSDNAVILGMIYNFLPFMVLPIYASLTRIDHRLVEAAHDLGARPFRVFARIVFPLSIPGVASGISMTFMPAMTTFVISRLLGGGQYTLIGNLVEQQFLYSGDWGFGSAVSLILMFCILLTVRFVSRYESAGSGQGGGLW